MQTHHWISFIRASHHSLTALNQMERWNMFFHHGSFWHLRARMLAPRSEKWRQGDIGKAKLCKSANRFGREKNCSFQCWLICMKINLAQALSSFIQHPRKEEISQLQQSNTSRGANRSNQWHQKIEKGVADAKIKHVLKKRSGICLSCRRKLTTWNDSRNTSLYWRLKLRQIWRCFTTLVWR